MNTTQKTITTLFAALTLASGSALATDTVRNSDRQALNTQQRTTLRTQLEDRTLLQLQQREQLKTHAASQAVRLPELTQTQARNRTQASVQTQTRTPAQTPIQMQGDHLGSAGMGSAGAGMGRR